MNWPTQRELQEASIELQMRPLRRQMDAMIASLPWHGRIIYRAASIYYSRKARR